ncbi:MAG: VWA domain-containing protein [Planctomycetota bacterium]|nr:VWA domain-containing protein [Planctomycetota bacterium]
MLDLAAIPFGVRVQDGWWLLLVPLMLVPIVLAWPGMALMSPLRRWMSVALRVALATIIALSLAGLNATRESDRLAVVAVLDVSDSVRRLAGSGSLDRSATFLDAALRDRRPDDVLGVVAAGAIPAAVASPTGTGLGGRSLDLALGSGTNLEAGLRLARAMVPPDARARIVLVSDGNQTAGDVLAAAREMAGQISIDVLPVRIDVTREARIEAVEAPQNAAAGAIVSVRVLLSTTAPVGGVLRLFSEAAAGLDPQPLAARRVALAPGRTIEVFDVTLPPGRVHRFLARLEPDATSSATGAPPADTIAENNEGRTFTITPGQGRVLLIEGQARPTDPPLQRVLNDAGYSVDRVTPASAPADVVGAQAYDLVILDNAPADAFSPAAMNTLVSHVRDLGGGLVMLGGRESFGAGGYKGTPIEPLLPVNLDLPERLVEPESAVVLVLDNSGSMSRSVMGSSRSQQAIANEAAAAAVLSLDKRDLVGVIVFNSSFDVLVPLAANTDARASAQRVLAINSDGGTDLPPALREAARQLDAVKAKSKSIIVLTDGISLGKEQLTQLSTELKEREITVSAIAVGDDADRAGMKAMADAGGGTFFDVRNPMTLPRILVRAVRVARSPLVRERPFVPLVVDPRSPLVQGLDAFPPLGGLSLTQPKVGATISNVLASDAGDPVLAAWSFELGRVVAFTSDASRWAERWLDWPGYRTFWLQVARSAVRAQTAAAVRAELTPSPGRLQIRATLDRASAPADSGDAAVQMQATLYAPDGTSRVVPLAQVGPGQYEGSADARDNGTYFAIVRPTISGRAIAPSLAGATLAGDDEFKRLSTNTELLQSIATTTGGRVLGPDDAAKLFDRGGVPPRRASIPLWPTLLPWIVVLTLADISCRRIAWDRWLRRERQARAAQPGTAATLERLRESQPVGPVESITLGTAEARELVQAARDRRRAQRLQGIVADRDQSPLHASADHVVPPSGRDNAAAETPAGADLLRAKRRAREKYEDD